VTFRACRRSLDEVFRFRPNRSGFTPEQTPSFPRSHHPRPSNLRKPGGTHRGQFPQTIPTNVEAETHKHSGLPAGDYPGSPRRGLPAHAGDHSPLTGIGKQSKIFLVRPWLHFFQICYISDFVFHCTPGDMATSFDVRCLKRFFCLVFDHEAQSVCTGASTMLIFLRLGCLDALLRVAMSSERTDTPFCQSSFLQVVTESCIFVEVAVSFSPRTLAL
jgi:hypothetical protein